MAIRATALAVAVLVVYLLTATITWRINGPTGVFHAGLAAAACLLGAETALLLSGVFRGTRHAFSGLLAGIFMRMSVPLALALACLAVSPRQPAGPLMYLLIFYPLVMAMEVILSLPYGESLKCE